MRSQLLPWGVAAAALLVCAYSYLDRPARPEAAIVGAHAPSTRPAARVEGRRVRDGDDRPRATWRPVTRPVEHDDDARERDEPESADAQPVDEDTRRRNESAVAAAHARTDLVIERGEFSRADVREITALAARAPQDERAAILQKLGRAINGDQITYVPPEHGSADRSQ